MTEVIATLSGDTSTYVRVYLAQEGNLIWESKPVQLAVGSPPGDITFAGDNGDVVALTDGYKVSRYDSEGLILWNWASEDQGSSVLWQRVIVNGNSIFVVGLTSSIRSYTLETVELDAVTGALVKQQAIKSSITNPDFELLVPSSGSPVAVWLEGQTVKTVRLGGNKVESVTIPDLSSQNLQIVYQGEATGSQFLVTDAQSSTAAWLSIDQATGEPKLITTISSPAASTAFAIAADRQGNGYLAVARGAETGLTIELHDQVGHVLSTDTHIESSASSAPLLQALLDVNTKRDGTVNSRLAVMKGDGSMEMWMSSGLLWSREEALAHAVDAVFVELPEQKVRRQGADIAAIENGTSPVVNFVNRLKRHIVQSRDLPAYTVSYFKHLTTGNYGSGEVSSTAAVRDSFGFRKLLVIATKSGKVIALDTSGKGQTVWTTSVAGSAEKLYLIRAIGVAPTLVVVSKLDGKTILTSLDGLTGAKDDAFKQTAGDVDHMFAIEASDDTPGAVAYLDEHSALQVFPDTVASRNAISSRAEGLSFAVVEKAEDQHRLQGLRLESDLSVTPVWNIRFSKDERIVSVVGKPQNERVSSLGRVLGNRQVLYKYLNPNMAAVLTTTKGGASPSLSVYLIDVVKGSILHEISHQAVNVDVAPNIAIAENWIVYSYYSDDTEAVKGQIINVLEAYESAKPDERFTSKQNMSSFANDERPFVLSQAYIFAQPIKAMGTTTTRNGITTKEVLMHLANGQLVAVSKRILDPRRPTKALTSEDKEEMLIPYDPIIGIHPRMALSHVNPVIGVTHIKTSSALLESTCLVVAYGLDVFFTRATPSRTFDVLSEDFSKGMLLATIVALGLGISITGPLVKSRQLKLRWYS